MVERRPGFQHAPFPADTVWKVLRGLCLLVSIRNLVAVIDCRHDVAACNHAVLHLRETFREMLHFLHSFAALAPAHGDRRKGAVAFWPADDDGYVNLIASQDESVVGGRVRP